MKRSPLRRKTPLSPGKNTLKRSPISRTSKKKRKRDRECKPLRDALKKRHPYCWVCGATWKPLTVHEIAKGGLREKALDQPCALLVACWDCNSGALEDPELWPIPRQLACLLVCAPENFDLLAFNRLRGRAETAVTMPEVDFYAP